MMKGRTVCPKCKHAFILDVLNHVVKYDAVCPKCGYKFNINPSKTSKSHNGCEVYSWEECGEPRKTILSALKEKTNKPTIAGVLLITAFILGVSWAGVFGFGESILKSSMDQAGVSGILGGVSGNVTDENNTLLSDVLIEVSGTNISTVTDQNGSYSLTNVSIGIQQLNITKEGYKPQIYEILVSPFPIMPFNMEMEFVGIGNEGPANNHSISELWNKIRSTLYFCSVIFAVFSIFALLGGLYAIKRKNFGIVIIGSIFGILSFGFIFGSVCSIIALILLIISKEEFGNGDAKEF
ncbi:Carboxypeptidase regulatory-like domain protein [Thermoplasmatales archaeon SCGC AB-539-N05]|nr:Carboxypeptidase regulatory-like domain protein [Thermoplasmatales archaeon SCGC AB-539-N05]